MRACFICKEEKRANIHDPFCGHREPEVSLAEYGAASAALFAAIERATHPARETITGLNGAPQGLKTPRNGTKP